MAEISQRIDPSFQSVGGKDEGLRPMTNKPTDAEKSQQITEILQCEVPLSLWLTSIMAEVKEGAANGRPQGPKIPKVDSDVVFKVKANEKKEANNRSNDESFRPRAVSIGPYHFFDRKAKYMEVEKLKVPMARQFIRDSKKLKNREPDVELGESKKGKDGKKSKDLEPDVELFYNKVKDEAELARGFYDKSSTDWFNDEQFTRVMFLDGCFILQFIHCVAGGYEGHEKEEESADINAFYEKLKNLSDRQVADVKRDLLLLRNQLPFPVLDALLKQRYKEGEERDWIDKFLPFRDPKEPFPMWLLLFFPFLFLVLAIFCCLYCCCSNGKRQESPAEGNEPPTSKENKQSVPGDKWEKDHLLGYLYWKLTHLKERDDVYKFIPGSGKTDLSLGTRGHYLYYSAKNLKKVGIHFRPSLSNAFTDVQFTSTCLYGTLRLPPITIDESTKSMLLNLMAYEAANFKDVAWVRSYIFFMDSLIDDAEDVKELRSKGIISNYLGSDRQVADLFNNMTKSLVEPSSRAYKDIKKKINTQCNSTFKKWVADSQEKYFSNPWSFVALIAAVFTIFLTAVATYIAVWPINYRDDSRM